MDRSVQSDPTQYILLMDGGGMLQRLKATQLHMGAPLEEYFSLIVEALSTEPHTARGVLKLFLSKARRIVRTYDFAHGPADELEARIPIWIEAAIKPLNEEFAAAVLQQYTMYIDLLVE